ncbi:MAG: hypothetical protein K2X66_01195 [Cyanobacteria bacterium]|nr:hypothetical protein [Cyanobacteriota bacterium]
MNPKPLVYKTIPNWLQRHQSGALNKIYAFDQTPLGNRTPLILVPGHGQEYELKPWWAHFYEYYRKDSAVLKDYKLFVYLYRSGDDLKDQATELDQQARKWFIAPQGPQPKMVFISYSLGGNITYQAMEDKRVNEQTEHVFGIAVPYHGSPIFSPDWFLDHARPIAFSPIRRIWDKLLFHTYFSSRLNLVRELQWDNFDGSIPLIASNTTSFSNLMQENSPTLVDVRQEVDPVAHPVPLSPRCNTALKQKLILYASFLENDYTHLSANWSHSLPDLAVRIPIQVVSLVKKAGSTAVGAVLPYYGFSLNGALQYSNHLMATLSHQTHSNSAPSSDKTPLLKELKVSERQRYHLYAFNDGVIPLSSMLFLPNQNKPYTGNAVQMGKAHDVQFVRIFKGLDHLEIGEYTQKTKNIRRQDLLKPSEQARSPIEWLLYDLAQLSKSRAPQKTNETVVPGGEIPI